MIWNPYLLSKGELWAVLEQEIIKDIEIANEKNVHSIFAWPYRAGEGSVLVSYRASMLWKMMGETYKKVRKIP